VKDVDRHLFFDKVKSLGIDSCLYEITNNDLVDDMKLWPPVTSPHVYCYLIETPGDFTWKTLKAYNLVISGWVKPLRVPKRNSDYDSHDATSSPLLSPILPPTSALSLFNEGLGVSPWENCGIKDVCRYVLEHFGGLMRLIIFP